MSKKQESDQEILDKASTHINGAFSDMKRRGREYRGGCLTMYLRDYDERKKTGALPPILG